MEVADMDESYPMEFTEIELLSQKIYGLGKFQVAVAEKLEGEFIRPPKKVTAWMNMFSREIKDILAMERRICAKHSAEILGLLQSVVKQLKMMKTYITDNIESTPTDADSVRNFTQSSSIPSEEEEDDDYMKFELLIPSFFFYEEEDLSGEVNVQPKEVRDSEGSCDKLQSSKDLAILHNKLMGKDCLPLLSDYSRFLFDCGKEFEIMEGSDFVSNYKFCSITNIYGSMVLDVCWIPIDKNCGNFVQLVNKLVFASDIFFCDSIIPDLLVFVKKSGYGDNDKMFVKMLQRNNILVSYLTSLVEKDYSYFVNEHVFKHGYPLQLLCDGSIVFVLVIEDENRDSCKMLYKWKQQGKVSYKFIVDECLFININSVYWIYDRGKVLDSSKEYFYFSDAYEFCVDTNTSWVTILIGSKLMDAYNGDSVSKLILEQWVRCSHYGGFILWSKGTPQPPFDTSATLSHRFCQVNLIISQPQNGCPNATVVILGALRTVSACEHGQGNVLLIFWKEFECLMMLLSAPTIVQSGTSEVYKTHLFRETVIMAVAYSTWSCLYSFYQVVSVNDFHSTCYLLLYYSCLGDLVSQENEYYTWPDILATIIRIQYMLNGVQVSGLFLHSPSLTPAIYETLVVIAVVELVYSTKLEFFAILSGTQVLLIVMRILNVLIWFEYLKWKFKLFSTGLGRVINVSWVGKGLISEESLVVKWNCMSHPFWEAEVRNLTTTTLMKGNLFSKSLQSLGKDSNYILILMGLLKHPNSSFCRSRELYFGLEESLGRVVGIKRVLVRVHGGEILV
ncbi:hypothetical protein MKX03_026911 [Papaver bracteatum]|nr:hypothetical protein MKX03_026911 [Papaver bracteatum]